jgi:hypothetical protein
MTERPDEESLLHEPGASEVARLGLQARIFLAIGARSLSYPTGIKYLLLQSGSNGEGTREMYRASNRTPIGLKFNEENDS